MAENIEWGACPVCGGRVAGKIDSWRSGDRLHVDQPCDEPPVCGNGCPLEDFAPRISFVVKCGDGEPAKEVMKKAVEREWSHMLGKVAHVDPCVCGGFDLPQAEVRADWTLTSPDAGAICGQAWSSDMYDYCTECGVLLNEDCESAVPGWCVWCAGEE